MANLLLRAIWKYQYVMFPGSPVSMCRVEPLYVQKQLLDGALGRTAFLWVAEALGIAERQSRGESVWGWGCVCVYGEHPGARPEMKNSTNKSLGSHSTLPSPVSASLCLYSSYVLSSQLPTPGLNSIILNLLVCYFAIAFVNLNLLD